MKGVFRSALTRFVFISALLVGFFILSGSSLASLDMEVGAATLEVTDLNLNQVGDTGWVEVKLDSVPKGVSGYKLQVSLERTSVGEITDHEFVAFNGASSVSSLPSDSVTFSAADMNENVQPGNGTTTLARLKLKAQESGSSTSIAVWIDKMDDDFGYAMSPSTNSGTLVVGSEDNNPPNPDPMYFSTNPHATGSSTIEMQAANASDPEGNGVQYKFRETTGHSGGTDTDWRNDRSWPDLGLSANTKYCYQVKARDKSGNQNETGWSNERCATTSERTITIIQPNGGETWQVGTMHAIKWNSTNAGGTVRIQLSTDGGGSWSNITSSTNNDGSYSWTPNTTSQNCLIKVSSTSYSVSDRSDNTFTISKEDTTPPELVTDFNASDGEDSQSTLTWTNPSDGDLTEVVLKRKTGSFPSNHSDGNTVYRNSSPNPGNSVTKTNKGLTNGTTYYYAVFSKDNDGNWNDRVIEGKNSDKGKPGVAHEGIDLQVYNQAGNPSDDAYVRVVERVDSGDDVSWVDGGRVDNNGQIHLEVESGAYILIVSSYEDNFWLKKNDVSAPCSLVMKPKNTVSVDFRAEDIYGEQLAGAYIGINYEWVDSIVGSTNSEGSLTVDMTPINSDTFVYSRNAGYLLVKENVSLDGEERIDFLAGSMNTGKVSLDVKSFPQDRFYYVFVEHERSRASSSVKVPSDMPFVVSAGTYDVQVDLQKDDDQGYSWEYWHDLGSHEVNNGDNISIPVGGTFSIKTIPGKSSYSPGEILKLKNRVEDEFGHRITWVNKYKYTNNSNSDKNVGKLGSFVGQLKSQSNSDINNKTILEELGTRGVEPKEYVHNYIYPHLIVKNPSGNKIIDEQNRDLWWQPYKEPLSNDVKTGEYTSKVSLNTGPHEGVIKDRSEFTVSTSSGDSASVFRVDKQGNVYSDASYYGQGLTTGSADLAEKVRVNQKVDKGHVLALNPKNPGVYRKSQKPYSTLAVGVVSTDPGITLSKQKSLGHAPIALVGTAPVKATAENGSITAGDLLTTSSKPGYAMLCKRKSKCSGAIIGKALGSLPKSEGKIRMLIMN